MEVKERREKLLKWFDENESKGMKLFLEDFEKDKREYVMLIEKINIAFEILEDNDFFEENEREKFMETNSALCVIEELIFNLDIHELPRSYVALLSVDLFDRALEFLTDTLKELNLIDEYYGMTN